MSHFILKRGRYWEEYENVPGKRGKKRMVKYWGKVNPIAAQARYEQMIATAERKAEEIDAYQRATFGETASEKRERLEDEARFSQEKFLERTIGPTSAETHMHQAQTEASQNQQEAQPADASSEASGNPGSDDASGS